MKKIFTILTMLFCTLWLEAEMEQNIYIKHIGENDRFFEVIVINTERDGSDLRIEEPAFYFYFKVDEATYKEIKKFIQRSSNLSTGYINNLLEYGTFEIIIEDNTENEHYYLIKRELSIQFFGWFIEEFSKRDDGDELFVFLNNAILKRILY